ncbi:MlaC/ttg2D family ABC transporter substrate-binding protein [Dokdonella sp.]|uniref:MlaC/ttg2D family ABC transporter substrate-binding protein n=1 Tax=Dokdonella sp. TaxID=2291710 RepID=UPI0031C21AC4|nr:ABC transporter substrate-binding protein [Dokdonella sp.]
MQRILVLAFGLLCGALAPFATHAAPASPEQIVQGIANDLGEAVDGHKAELKQDRKKLIQVIDDIFLPHFDIDYASILVLGQYARTSTPAQRVRFARAFYDSLVNRYAEGLLNYTRGSVRVLPMQGDLNDKRTIVRTQVVLDDGKTIAVDYAFRKERSGEWKAYDVIIEGISYITNFRNQVGEEIRKTSLDALITRLENNGQDALDSLEQGGK